MLLQGLSDETLSKAQIKPISTLDDVIKHATKVQKQVKVRNNHYSLSHSSVTSQNFIGVSNGEYGVLQKEDTDGG